MVNKRAMRRLRAYGRVVLGNMGNMGRVWTDGTCSSPSDIRGAVACFFFHQHFLVDYCASST